MELVFKRPEIHMNVRKKRRQPDLSEIFYRRDASYPMTKAVMENLEIREYTSSILEVVGKGTSTRKHFAVGTMYMDAASLTSTVFSWENYRATYSTQNFKGWNGSAYENTARVNSGSGAGTPHFEILQSGHIIPYDNLVPNLGDASHAFLSAWIQSVLLDFLIFDAGDSLSYDTTNNRFLFKIGGSTVGYVDATGFHDGAP